MKHSLKNFLLTFAIIVTIIVLDRILLNYLGLPLWEWDEELHYKHRPNMVKYWMGKEKKPILINEYGQHYNSFPVKKKQKELRILNLGDSITMGHGVTRDETYSKYLEKILTDSLSEYDIVRAINTGVQGYSVFQELEMLKRSMRFKPDFVTIGFCLNDVTEPFAVNKTFGGSGLDYHRVTQATNKYLSFLLNETGFGRLIQEIRINMLEAKQEKLAEIFDVKKMLTRRSDSTYITQWNFTLNTLEKIYSFCNQRDIEVILLLFPYTFQLENKELAWSHTLLKEHALKNNIYCIDFLEIFQNEPGIDKITIKNYFLDENHFTPLGHYFISKQISGLIISTIKSGSTKQAL